MKCVGRSLGLKKKNIETEKTTWNKHFFSLHETTFLRSVPYESSFPIPRYCPKRITRTSPRHLDFLDSGAASDASCERKSQNELLKNQRFWNHAGKRGTSDGEISRQPGKQSRRSPENTKVGKPGGHGVPTSWGIAAPKISRQKKLSMRILLKGLLPLFVVEYVQQVCYIGCQIGGGHWGFRPVVGGIEYKHLLSAKNFRRLTFFPLSHSQTLRWTEGRPCSNVWTWRFSVRMGQVPMFAPKECWLVYYIYSERTWNNLGFHSDVGYGHSGKQKKSAYDFYVLRQRTPKGLRRTNGPNTSCLLVPCCKVFEKCVFYCVLPYKTALGGSWGGLTIYI